MCTKSFDGCGFAPNPIGELTALPGLLAVLTGPTSKGRQREGEERRERKGGRGTD